MFNLKELKTQCRQKIFLFFSIFLIFFMIWTDDFKKQTAGMGPGRRIFFIFCVFCFSWTNFRTRFWPRGHVPRGYSVNEKEGLEKLIC